MFSWVTFISIEAILLVELYFMCYILKWNQSGIFHGVLKHPHACILIDAQMLTNMAVNSLICCAQWFWVFFRLLHVCLSVLQVVYNGKELNHPFGISHYRNYIFWTEYMNASVFQLELSTGDVTLLRSERPPLFGLRVYDAQSQQGELIWMCSVVPVLLLCLHDRSKVWKLPAVTDFLHLQHHFSPHKTP